MELTPEQRAEIEASEAIRQVLGQQRCSDRVPATLSVMFRGANGAVGRRDFGTHWIHPYPAKMFHRIPREIFRSLELAPDTIILDPFCGSGTVLLEGALQGHHTLGIDINPLARLISRVKTTLLDPRHLKHHAWQIITRAKADQTFPPPDKTFDFWFKPEAKTSLHRLRRAIDRVSQKRYRDFFLVGLTRIVRRVSLADPSIPPPVRLNSARAEKVNTRRYRRDLARAQSVNAETVFDNYRNAVDGNIRRMAEFAQWDGFGSTKVLSGRREAARTGLSRGSVDLIMTSPPYCGAQKYVRSLRLEMLWLGVAPNLLAEIDQRTLGTERVSVKRAHGDLSTADKDANLLIEKIRLRNPVRAIMVADYIRYLHEFAEECRRVLRLGGDAFVTFGTSHVAGIEIDMARFFRAAAEDKGLKFVTTLVDKIPSRGLITKRHSTAGRIDDERVVWLRG